MERKATVFLLWTLLLSTLAHEFTERREKGPANTHLSEYHRKHDNCDCHTQTTSTEKSTAVPIPRDIEEELLLVVNATSRIISAVRSNVSVTLDFNAHLVATINLSSGAIIIANNSGNSGVYFSSGKLNLSLSIEALARINLTTILRDGRNVGISFTSNNIPARVSRKIVEVLTEVSVELKLTLRNSSLALEYLSDVAAPLFSVFEQSTGYLTIRSGIAPLRYELLSLLTVAETVYKIVANVNTSGDVLEKNNVTIDFLQVLGSQSGVQLVLVVLRSIAAIVDLNKVPTNRHLDVLELIVQTSVNVGSSNLIDVIVATVVALRRPHGTHVEDLLQVLISYLSCEEHAEEVKWNWKEAIKDIANVTASTNSSILDPLDSFAKNLTANSSIISNVNLTEIVEVLTVCNDPSEIDIVVQVLLALRKRVSLESTLPNLIVAVVKILVDGNIYILKLLDSKVDINANITEIDDGLLDIEKILANPGPTLSGIPVIGTIVNQTALSLNRRSNAKLKFDVIIDSCVSRGILNVIPSILHPRIIIRPLPLPRIPGVISA